MTSSSQNAPRNTAAGLTVTVTYLAPDATDPVSVVSHLDRDGIAEKDGVKNALKGIFKHLDQEYGDTWEEK